LILLEESHAPVKFTGRITASRGIYPLSKGFARHQVDAGLSFFNLPKFIIGQDGKVLAVDLAQLTQASEACASRCLSLILGVLPETAAHDTNQLGGGLIENHVSHLRLLVINYIAIIRILVLFVNQI